MVNEWNKGNDQLKAWRGRAEREGWGGEGGERRRKVGERRRKVGGKENEGRGKERIGRGKDRDRRG